MNNDTIATADALLVLAFMGDLSMGQPVDHSKRVAWLSRRMAQELGADEAFCRGAGQVALLRWAGCSANATEVARLISDDVGGRNAMLALRPDDIKLLVSPNLVERRIAEISAIHCEVSVLIAATLGLAPMVIEALAGIFECWDGSGLPAGKAGDAIPLPVLLVKLAGDLEIFNREYGLAGALDLLRQRANASYPRCLVDMLCRAGAGWLKELETQEETVADEQTDADAVPVSLSLVADAIDLKLPWLTGYSRAVAQLGATMAARLEMTPAAQARVRRAGLLHGLGRAAIPNAVWNRPAPFSLADWEQARLSPYWTARAASQVKSLAQEAEIASTVYERLDGSGYFRAARSASTPLECRILPLAASWLALQAPRPWRPALNAGAAIEHLQRQTALGRFDPRVLAVLDSALPPSAGPAAGIEAPGGILSPRELEVLRCIAQGDSNKEAARKLGVSPSTIRTHMENTFRKLECKSRAAATLKASLLGLL